MKRALRAVGGAVATGLAWAAVWAPIAVVIGTTIVDPDDSMDEMWLAVGAYPGFLSGAVFTAARGIAGGGRGLAETSIPRLAAFGAVSGLLVGALPFFIGTPSSEYPLVQLAGLVIGGVTVLSALSAVGTGWVARAAARRRLPAGASERS